MKHTIEDLVNYVQYERFTPIDFDEYHAAEKYLCMDSIWRDAIEEITEPLRAIRLKMNSENVAEVFFTEYIPTHLTVQHILASLCGTLLEYVDQGILKFEQVEKEVEALNIIDRDSDTWLLHEATIELKKYTDYKPDSSCHFINK